MSHVHRIDRAEFLRGAAGLGLVTLGVRAMPHVHRLDRAEFLRGAAGLGLVNARRQRRRRRTRLRSRRFRVRLTHRGVTYDTGIGFGEDLTRRRWSRGLMEGEITAIRRHLHCNAVSVTGSVVPRLVSTAATALRQGLHVMVQPRLYDRPHTEILDQLARTAAQAERLRTTHPDRVTLIVGCEHTLFTPGIVPGDTFFERIENLSKGRVDPRQMLERLNAFLAQAATVARRHFGGPVTYAAASFEKIDWTPFDIIGLDYYEFHIKPAGHVRELEQYRRWGKPILICEFGCCTYKGAPERGGMGWDIIDYDEKPRPQVIGDPVRSEATQARYIERMANAFEAQDLLGAFVYTFISPDVPHSQPPEYDLDIGAFSVVKVLPENERDPASKYTWKPKRAFRALAVHNRGCRT